MNDSFPAIRLIRATCVALIAVLTGGVERTQSFAACPPDSVAAHKDTALVKTAMPDSACGLVITSVPESAAVYVEHVFVGRAPVRLMYEKGGAKPVQVMRQNFGPWEERVLLIPGATVTVNARLKSKFGTLSLDVFADDIDVVIDGKTVSTGSLADYMIAGGWHDIGARKAGGGEQVTESVYFFPGQSARWQARFDVPSRRAFFWSLLLPGLGQMMSGAPAKGTVLMGGCGAACLFSGIQYLLFQSNLKDFNSARDKYRLLKDEAQAKAAGDALASQYQSAKNAHNLVVGGIVVAGAVYVVSLVDAWVNHSTENTITQPDASAGGFLLPDVAAGNGGAQVRLTYTF